jgi:hypothetical protein
MEKKYQLLANSVMQTLHKDLGIPMSELKLESRVHDVFTCDIRYKDYVIEVNGPFHYVHDPYYL